MANPQLPIDVLRTKCWLREVMRSVGCDEVDKLHSLYIEKCNELGKSIPMAYQSLDIRWGDYESGKNRPSQDTLDAVNSVLKVDSVFYNHGPDDLLLWNALWYTNSPENINKLQIIADTSKLLNGTIALDATIAKLRLEVFLHRASVNCFLSNLYTHIEYGYSKMDIGHMEMPSIVDELNEVLKLKDSVEDVINYLLDDIFPYAYPAHYAEIMDSRAYSPAYIEAVMDEYNAVNKLALLHDDKPSRSTRSK